MQEFYERIEKHLKQGLEIIEEDNGLIRRAVMSAGLEITKGIINSYLQSGMLNIDEATKLEALRNEILAKVTA